MSETERMSGYRDPREAILDGILAAFSVVHLDGPGGRVLKAAGEFNLSETVRRCAAEYESSVVDDERCAENHEKPCDVDGWWEEDEEEDEDPFDVEDWWSMGGLVDLGPTRTLIECEWDGFGPISWWAAFEAVDLGKPGSLVWWRTEWIDYDCLPAVIQPRGAASVWAEFLVDLLRDNGRSYGTGIWGDPPSLMTNHAPELIPERVVRQAVHQWLDGMGDRAWTSLRDRTLTLLEEPDPLQRARDLMDQLVRLGPEGFLEAEAAAVEVFSDEDKAMVIDNYMALSYRERPGGRRP